MLDRAVAVLRSLADGETESTAGEIARAVGLHKSTVHRLLMVLEHHRLVQKSPGGYQLGTGLLELGEKASARLTLSERAGPSLRELSAHTGEGAHVTVISDTDMLAIAHVEGRWNLQPLTRTGSRTQIHCTAAGKAVLAFLSTEACDGIIARLSFPRLTRRTIVTPAAFKLELMRFATPAMRWTTKSSRTDSVRRRPGVRSSGPRGCFAQSGGTRLPPRP